MFRGCLIGCGYVSQFHLRAWPRQKLGTLVAVCDLDENKAKASARQSGTKAYTNATEMFERERPDFVEICTRPESHLSLIRLAAERGIHVLCQKPIAPNLDQLDEMITACRRGGVRFMVHENYRWRSWFLRMKEEMQAGRLGQVFRLGHAMHDQRCLKPAGLADQPYFADMPRLILYEIGPHAVDLARWFFGEPVRVSAVIQHIGAQRGEDVVHLALWFPDGRMAYLDLSWASAGRNIRPEWGLHDTWIDGSKGTLRTRSDGQLEWIPVDGGSEILAVAMDADPLVESYARTQAHFLECLQSGQRFATDGEDTRKTMRVIFAGYESVDKLAPVQL